MRCKLSDTSQIDERVWANELINYSKKAVFVNGIHFNPPKVSCFARNVWLDPKTLYKSPFTRTCWFPYWNRISYTPWSISSLTILCRASSSLFAVKYCFEFVVICDYCLCCCFIVIWKLKENFLHVFFRLHRRNLWCKSSCSFILRSIL